MKALHTVSAALEAGAGLALLSFPSATVVLLIGAPLETPAALSVARVGGAGLLALGVACWFARYDAQSCAARGVVSAMVIYNVAAVATLSYASLGYGLHGLGLWPTVILHAAMAVWCVASLLNTPPRAKMDSNKENHNA